MGARAIFKLINSFPLNPSILPLFRPTIFAPFPQLFAGQSTRHGGVSPTPFASMNLGKSTADAPENVAENRRRICATLGFVPAQMAWSHQVHGDEVLHVRVPGGADGFDALVTQQPGVLLAVSVADCTPILVYDPRNAAVAAIHAGWRGTAAGIVGKTLQHMAQLFGTRGQDCRAYVGTCIDAYAFEVGEEVAAAFPTDFKRFDTERGKFFVDLKKANAAQLQDFGLPLAHIEISPYCTVRHNADYFSHRLERGTTGRMMALIGIK